MGRENSISNHLIFYEISLDVLYECALYIEIKTQRNSFVCIFIYFILNLYSKFYNKINVICFF